MQATRRALAAIATGLTLLVAGAPADATPDEVEATDFPGVAQIAEILPAYAGGDRTIEQDHAIWIFRDDCQSYEEGPSGQVRKYAYYYAPASSQPSLPLV